MPGYDPKYNATAYEWDRKNTVFVGMKLMKSTDADIIEALAKGESKQGEAKRLIRYAIENGGRREK